MKEYTEINSPMRVLKEVKCNKCGKVIGDFLTIEKTDFLEVSKRWNYFSPFDNQVHEFHLCINCYTELINSFNIPLED